MCIKVFLIPPSKRICATQDNPKDKQKVKDIIARMKSDAMVEKIQAQFKHDDESVGDVIHSADPSADSHGI